MSEKNIDGLCSAIKNNIVSVLSGMLINSISVMQNIKSADDVLNLKFNLLKKVIAEYSIIKLKSYKDFFKNSDATNDLDNQNGTNQSKIERVNLGNSVNSWQSMTLMFNNVHLMQEFNDKVRLSDVKEAIEKGQPLNSNNGFIKICKGIYKFTYGFPKDGEESAEILSHALNQFAQNVDKWANDTG